MTPVLIRELSGYAMERDMAGAVDKALRAKVWEKVLPNGLLTGGGGGPSCLVDYTSVLGQPGSSVFFSRWNPSARLEKMKFHVFPRLGTGPQGREGRAFDGLTTR